jgi:putative ABC transport system permease protein
MHTFLRELTYAWRSLRRSPGLTAAVVVTMALGIGANAAIFSVVEGVLLRPLPFPGSERVVTVCETHPEVEGYCVASPPDVADFAARSRTFEAMGVARSWPLILEGKEGSETLRGGTASAGFFTVGRARAGLGRLLRPADLEPGAERVVVLSDGLWHRRFGADPGIVGQPVVLDGKPVTVVGVLAAGTYLPVLDWVEAWVPLTGINDDVTDRSWRGFRALGRLASGATPAGAERELAALGAELAREHPETNEGWGVRIEGLRERLVGGVRPTLIAFLGAVGFVLLIGCANVANLLLVRATRRRLDFAVRASLGAGRLRLARGLLAESLLLSLAGGALGLGLAAWATEAFRDLAPATLPRVEEVGVDARVVAFAALLSVATALLFGLAPALAAWRADLAGVLKGGSLARRSGDRLRGLLVVGELALASLLLVGAGLMIRSFGRFLTWEPGFDRSGLATVWLLAPQAKYPQGAQAVEVLERAAAAARALPGVRAAGLSSAGPLFGGDETGALTVEGREPAAEGEGAVARWFDVDDGYFATLGVPLVRGRGFSGEDGAASVPVALVNQALVRRFFPGEDPLGRRVTVEDRTAEIVGVVADVRPLRPDAAPVPEIYWPKRQYPRWASYLLLRADGDPAALEPSLQAALARLDPDLQAAGFATFEEQLGRELVSPRFNVLLIAVFAALAVLLAAIGTSGVMAYAVASRTREIGVRMALGARPAVIRRQVLARGMALAAAGLGLGLAGALAVGRGLGSILYGLSPADPPTLAAVGLLFAAVALAACYLPARRASRLDPLRALRSD